MSGDDRHQQSQRTVFNWNEYCDRLTILIQLYEHKRFVDLELVTEDGGKEHVHFTAISALGKEFSDFIEQKLDNCNETSSVVDTEGNTHEVKQVKLNMDRNSLRVLVLFAYKGIIEVKAKEDVLKMLEIAEEYNIRHIILACCSFMASNVSVDNCVECLLLGSKFNHGKLRNSSRKTISANLTKVYIELTKLNQKKVKDILDSDYVSASEEVVCQTIHHWIEHSETYQALSDQQKTMGLLGLFDSLRYLRLTLPALDALLASPIVQNNSLLLDKVTAWCKERQTLRHKLDGHLLPCGVVMKARRPRIPHEVMLCYGGWQSGSTTSLAEVYDFQTNSFYKYNCNEGPKVAYCGLEFYKGSLYVVGGTDGTTIASTLKAFNMEKKEWSDLVDMSFSRCYVTTVIFQDKLYAIGGHSGDTRMRSVEIYDFETGNWEIGPEMNVTRSDASAAVINNRIYVVGGLNEIQIESSVEYLDLETNTWVLVAQMHNPRTSLAVVAFGNYLYALGGNTGQDRSNTAEKYNPSTNQWALIPTMNSKRSTFSACVLNDKIYTVGGYDGSSPIKHVEYYDPIANCWTQAAPLSRARSGLSVITLRDLKDMKELSYHGYQSAPHENGSDVEEDDDHLANVVVLEG